MKNAKQYAIAKAAIEAGSLDSMRDLQRIVPITELCIDMKLNYNTLSKRLLDPSRFTVMDIKRLAKLTGVDPTLLLSKMGQGIVL